MPDRFGFNLLGREVSCVDCDARGPAWRWPDRARAHHQAEHEREKKIAAAKAARARAAEARRLARLKDRENKRAYQD